MKNWILKILALLISIIIAIFIIIHLSNRITQMISLKKLICFYEYSNSNITNDFAQASDSFVSFFTNFASNFTNFFMTLISPQTFANLLMLMNVLILLLLVFYLFFTCSNLSYKESRLAILLIKFVEYVKLWINDIKVIGKKNKKYFSIVFLFISLIVPYLLFELLLFFIKYYIGVFNLTGHLIFIDLLKYLIVEVFHFFTKNNPIIVFVVICIIWVFIARSLAFKKLNNNWQKFKRMIANSAVINAISGEPSSGKTLTLSQVALANTENIIEKYEKYILEFEILNPNVNFAKIRLLLRIFYLDFEEKEISNILKSAPTIFVDLLKLHKYIDSDVSLYFFNEYYRGSNIISMIPITDPYYDSFSRVGNLNTMRFYKKLDSFPYEPDISLIFPEYDKEFNSHDDKKTVGEDGTFAFFALISHLLERSGVVFLDCQDKDQGIKRIRGVAGGFYHLVNRRVKMPFMLLLIYKPILYIYNLVLKIMIAYLGGREKTEKKWTVRRKQTLYKRNNLSLFYQSLKYLALLLNRVIAYFEKFEYFKINALYSTTDDFKNARKISYNLNLMDFDHKGKKIYNSTPFKKFYDDIKSTLNLSRGLKQNLLLVDKWTSLEPGLLEYAKTGQRAYAKIVEAQFKKDEED